MEQAILDMEHQKSVGLDPGFGSSNFGVCITELVDGIVNVMHAEEYPRPDFNQMINTAANLARKYDISFEMAAESLSMAAIPLSSEPLKDRLDEDPEYEKHIEILKRGFKQNYSLERQGA
jgi:hypothetical protein